jgi:hypothetical protein
MPAVVIALLALPVVAIGGILVARRWRSSPKLANALLLAGVTGAILTACFASSKGTVPIAPYEWSAGAWTPLLGQILLSLYIGFGLGVAIVAIGIMPFLAIRSQARRGGDGNPERPDSRQEKG